MRKSIFIKSMLRQPVRTALLALLAAAGAFVFTLFAAERMTIKDAVEGIGRYYRSIGYLTVTNGGGVIENNVFSGAEIVESSKYTTFGDRRRGVEGVLQGMHSADILGVSPIDELFDVNHRHHADAFFYGTLIDMEYAELEWQDYMVERLEPSGLLPPLPQPHVRLTFLADDVLTGYPEHAVDGQNIIMRYFLTEAELAAYHSAGRQIGDGNMEVPETAIGGMAPGQRYFVRGAHYNQSHYTYFNAFRVPEQGRHLDMLVMKPLNETTDHVSGSRSLAGAAAWYAAVEPGEAVGPETPGLEGLEKELIGLRHGQSAIQLRTTADMTAMPIMQPDGRIIEVTRGRLLDREDHLNANSVAVISQAFARIRGLQLGDKITVSVPQEQVLSRTHDVRLPGRSDFVYRGAPNESHPYELELEIVGVISFVGESYFIETVIEQAGNAGSYYPYNIVYIPDSILTRGYTMASSELMMGRGVPSDPEDGYVAELQYSFVIGDARDEQAFLKENGDRLAALGYDVNFIPSNAMDFWDSAEAIINGATLNAAAFTAVFAAALLLVAFLHQLQRRKESAILRSLGKKASTVNRQMLGSLALFCLPSIAIGCVAAWSYAGAKVQPTLSQLSEISGTEAEASFPVQWLSALALTAFLAMIALSIAATAAMSRGTILSQLQNGKASANQKTRAREGEP